MENSTTPATNQPQTPTKSDVGINTNAQNTAKVDIQSNNTTEKINIENTEKKGTPSYGFIENLKRKWQAHVEKNKIASEKRKKTSIETNTEKSIDKKEIGKSNDNVIDKKIAGFSAKKTDLDLLFDNFDPKKDKKKLTKEIRKRIIAAEKLYQSGTTSIKDLIAPSSVEITSHNMKLNGMFVKSFFVFNYPRFLEANWLNPLINFDATMDISIFTYPTKSDQMLKILKKKVAEMLSTKHINQKRGAINDTALDTALEDAEQLRVDLQRGIERFFQVGLYFTIYAETEDKLNKAAKKLETILGGQMIMTRSGDFQVERAFESTLPQATDLLDVVQNMNTSPLSTMFPFVSNDLTSNEGILYGLNRHNNSLIIFDRFSLENANEVIFAKSGAGKSYAVKLEILRSLMMGTDVMVLDPENEYETLTKTVGGTYINVSLNSNQRINPFDLPKTFSAEEKPGEALREAAINLTGLMGLMLGNLTPTEQGILDKAILQTYQIKGITTETENPGSMEMPTMHDLKNMLDSMAGGKDLGTRLERFTSGTFSGLFSDQTNVDLNSGLVVFCIRDLEEQLRPISMYILLNFIWNKIRSELKRRILVVDEAWNIVQYEDSGRFLHGLVKRARKYYLGVTTITQDVEDFLDSRWGKPIIANSSLQMLLRQAPIAIEKLKKVFNLTEQEQYLLLNSGVGQGLFFAGNQHVAIQIIASHGEDKIITTNPEELLAQRS